MKYAFMGWSALLAGVAVVLVVTSAVFADGYTLATASTPSTRSVTPASIPPTMLRIYLAAAASCPGLPWSVLAAIGTVESDNGTSKQAGVTSGHNDAGAEGPMQFEPATFARYALPVPAGGARPPSPYDATDAVYAAARLLCADGGANPVDLGRAIYAYNHSDIYVATVMATAGDYGLGPATAPPTSAVAVAYAVAQLGTPYRWGGETPGVGFDCSGLVQAAWLAAGVALPRVAQAQFDAGPAVAAGQGLEPGDLVFFGASAAAVAHVGMYLGDWDGLPLMVDAPHAGATVRLESFPDVLGGRWGDESFLGATRP